MQGTCLLDFNTVETSGFWNAGADLLALGRLLGWVFHVEFLSMGCFASQPSDSVACGFCCDGSWTKNWGLQPTYAGDSAACTLNHKPKSRPCT